MPKLPLAVNVLAYALSSHSGGGMARASLDDEEVWEDDFQTPHSPACHIVRWNGGSHREPALERMEDSGGSPGWQSFFPDGHWRGGAGDPRGHRSSLESHVLATSGCPGHSQRRGALVQVGHSTNIRGGGCGISSWHGSGTSRCTGRTTVHLLQLSSILVSL